MPPTLFCSANFSPTDWSPSSGCAAVLLSLALAPAAKTQHRPRILEGLRVRYATLKVVHAPLPRADAQRSERGREVLQHGGSARVAQGGAHGHTCTRPAYLGQVCVEKNGLQGWMERGGYEAAQFRLARPRCSESPGG